jgi:hypothetical protein
MKRKSSDNQDNTIEALSTGLETGSSSLDS